MEPLQTAWIRLINLRVGLYLHQVLVTEEGASIVSLLAEWGRGSGGINTLVLLGVVTQMGSSPHGSTAILELLPILHMAVQESS